MNNHINNFPGNNSMLKDALFQKKMSLYFEQYKAQYFEKGTYIFMSGSSSKNLYYIVNDGRIRLEFYSKSGRNVTRSILGQGDILGKNALIGIEKHKYTARARSFVKVRVIPIEDVEKLIKEPNIFTMLLLKKIGHDLIQKEKKLETLVLKDARTRVIEFLLDLGRKGRRVGFEQLVNNILTHQEIADLTSTSRQTVTTTISELRRKNILIFNRRRMLIRDMEQLAAAI